MNWYLAALKKFAVFEGRASRTEFWMFALFNLIFSMGLGMVDGVIGTAGMLAGLYGLAVLIPYIAVTVRRLHDTGRTGWWILIALIPVVGTIVLLIFMILGSDEGSNEYGPDPRGVTP